MIDNVLPGCSTLPALDSLPEAAPNRNEGGAARRKAADRFAVLNSFVDVTLADLRSRGDVAVWLVLYRDTRNGTARTSQADIARRVGMSPRGVAKALRRLEQRGLVKCVYRGGLGRGVSRYLVRPYSRTDDGASGQAELRRQIARHPLVPTSHKGPESRTPSDAEARAST